MIRSLFCFAIALLAPLAQAQSVTISPCVFSGAGLNDATCGGKFSSAPGNHFYVLTLSSTGTPDKFTWKKDGGSASAAVNITGSAQAIADGVTVRFAATTGHTAGNTWTVTAGASGSIGQQSFIQRFKGALFRSGQDKLRDIVSLKDYCAGDGVQIADTCLAAAISALKANGSQATTAGARLIVPSGTYLISQTATIQGFQGLRVECDGWASVFKWVGSSATVPMLMWQGNTQSKLSGCEFLTTTAHPNLAAIQVCSNATATPPTSTGNAFEDLWILSDGSSRYPVKVGGYGCVDGNNDFIDFHRVRIYGWSDTALWLIGGQSYSHRITSSAFNANGTAGPYGIRASTIAGGPIVSASWSAGVATFQTLTPHDFASGGTQNYALITAVSPAGYNVTDPHVNATVIDATHFSVPIVVNPGSYVSGGTVTGPSSHNGGNAASFYMTGGGFATGTEDVIIDGYSAAPFIVQYEDSESVGNMLLWRNGSVGVFIREQGRWNKVDSSTDTDTNLVDVNASGIVLLREFAQIGSFGATANDITLKYVCGGGTNNACGLFVSRMTIGNDNVSSASLLTGDQVTAGDIHFEDFWASQQSSPGLFEYTSSLPITPATLAAGATSIDAATGSSFVTNNGGGAATISTIYYGSPSTTCAYGTEIKLFAADANTSIDGLGNLVYYGPQPLLLNQFETYTLRCGPLNTGSWTVYSTPLRIPGGSITCAGAQSVNSISLAADGTLTAGCH